jgi:TatD DNase family protein
MSGFQNDSRPVDAHRHGPVDRRAVLALRCVTLAEVEEEGFDDPGPLSVGLHPWDVRADCWASDLLRLESRAVSDPRIVAIGEAGMDRSRGPDRSLQEDAFVAQAELATRLALPLVVHCVRSASDLLGIHRRLRSHSPWILHGWNGSAAQTGDLLDKTDFVFSFGASLLREDSKARTSVAIVPDERILLETDTADVAIESVERAAAELRGTAPANLRTRLHANWRALFA